MSQTNVQKIHNLYIYTYIRLIYICMYILTKVLHCLWGCIKPNIHISSCVGHRSGRAEPFPWNYVFTCNAKAFRVRDVEHFFFFFWVVPWLALRQSSPVPCGKANTQWVIQGVSSLWRLCCFPFCVWHTTNESSEINKQIRHSSYWDSDLGSVLPSSSVAAS